MKNIYDLNSIFIPFGRSGRTEHNELDLQIIEEQKSFSHFNPNQEYYRYKLFDKKTGRFYKYSSVPKLSSSTYLIDQFNGKYYYKPAPYRKYSPRKLFWFLQRLWWKKNIFFGYIFKIICFFFKSNFTNQLWSIIRGVIILLIAYTLWEFYGEEILNQVKNIWT